MGEPTAPTVGSLKVKFVEGQNVYVLQSPNIRPGKLNTLRGTAITTPGSTVTHMVEEVAVATLTGTGLSQPVLRKSIAIRVRQGNGKPPTEAYRGFTVEITEYDQ